MHLNLVKKTFFAFSYSSYTNLLVKPFFSWSFYRKWTQKYCFVISLYEPSRATYIFKCISSTSFFFEMHTLWLKGQSRSAGFNQKSKFLRKKEFNLFTLIAKSNKNNKNMKFSYFSSKHFLWRHSKEHLIKDLKSKIFRRSYNIKEHFGDNQVL